MILAVPSKVIAVLIPILFTRLAIHTCPKTLAVPAKSVVQANHIQQVAKKKKFAKHATAVIVLAKTHLAV
jgi:hypothetical protein